MKYEDKKICYTVFRRVPVMSLVLLLDKDKKKENCMSDISKKIDATYSHTAKLFADFEKMGLLTSMIVGRKRIVKLTGEGETVAKHLQAIIDIDTELNG